MIIPLSHNKPKQELIEFIESLLDEARSGELQGLLIASVMKDGRTGNAWSGIDSCVMPLIGEIEVLKRDFIDLMVDLRIDPSTGEEI